MAGKQRLFTQEFEEEAVRLVATSRHTQRKIAEDLGIGLSTLHHWLERQRAADRQNPPMGEERTI